jgi:hypothetical protein
MMPSSGRTQPLGWTDKEVKVVKEKCWNCGKAVKVPADNNNIYTRICNPCAKAIASTSSQRNKWVQ